jgi:hypothetical protein
MLTPPRYPSSRSRGVEQARDARLERIKFIPQLKRRDVPSGTPRRLDILRGPLAGEAAVSFGSEMESRRTSTFESLVRPAAQPFGSEMPPGRACAVSRHRMTKAAGPAPPSRPAALSGIGVADKGRAPTRPTASAPLEIKFLSILISSNLCS